MPEHRDVALRAYVIVLGALAARLLARAVVVTTWSPEPRAFDLALRARAPRPLETAADPTHIAHELGSSVDRAMELHYRLRIRLREIAADRLAADHGLALDDDHEAARRLLGDEAWALLRPDREPPEDRFGLGMALPDLERVVAAVERL